MNVILELARKEILSYYSSKPALLRNVIMLGIFSVVPVQQVLGVLEATGYSTLALSQTLQFYMVFAGLYAVIVSASISMMAFPMEKDFKTLEYLLSLPLKDKEIFAGKTLAAVISGLASLVLIDAIIVVAIFVFAGDKIAWTSGILTPGLVIAAIVLSPSFVVLSTLLMVAVSAFLKTSREAYFATFIAIGLFLGVIYARNIIAADMIEADILIAAALLALSAASYIVAVKTFSRERLISAL